VNYLSKKQIDLLLQPIHRKRVLQRDGMSYVEGYDIRAELNRVFGFGRWSEEVLDQALICETQVKTKTYADKKTGEQRGGKDAWYVVYRTRLRLAIDAPDGTRLASYDGSHVGESTHPVRGEAHGNALTNSETYALKRCAQNLGDQFGLSLYNKGSLEKVVRWTLVTAPEDGKPAAVNTDDVLQVSAEQPQQAVPDGSEWEGEAPLDDRAEAAQAIADEASLAHAVSEVSRLHAKAADNDLLAHRIRNPATGGDGPLGTYLTWRRRLLSSEAKALAELRKAGEAAGLEGDVLDARVQELVGAGIEDATVAQMKEAAAKLAGAAS
jgi:signal transduction histidine kinase